MKPTFAPTTHPIQPPMLEPTMAKNVPIASSTPRDDGGCERAHAWA